MGKLCVILLALCLTCVSWGQTASLKGQVTDQSGAIVPGASVTLTDSKGAVKSTTSDETGSYTFAGIAPGNYSVQASAPQLAMPQAIKVSLKPGAQALNLQLRIASMVEKVTVAENGGPSVSTAASNNANAVVLTGSDLDALSDNPDDLLADLQALAGPAVGPSGGALFIDGFSGGELPPKESIREIRINQNPFSPEYDKTGFGRIEVFTKPGADKWRGSVDYNLGTQWWNSRNPYASQKAPFLLQEFEGGTAGPLTKKMSLTLDAQRNMVDNGSITNGYVADPASFAILPFNSVLTTKGRFTRVTPRIDWQASEKHTLTFRYGVTRSGAQDAGIGGFDLISRGYRTHFLNQTLQAADTMVLGTTVNETRFQYFRASSELTANAAAPAVLVLGAFNGGGSTVGHTLDTQNSFELQNYTSMIRKTHSIKFGIRMRGQTDDSEAPSNFNGTFTFGNGGIQRYALTLMLQAQGYSPAAIRAMGGGATQFTMNAGIPELGVHQVDVGLFVGDDWRVKPNLTLSYGLRYETQSNMGDRHDFAPRLAMAWAPKTKSGKSNTVLRAGFGMFYDRLPLSATLTAQRFNGIVEQQYVVQNPDFFPNVPTRPQLAGFQTTQTIQQIDARIRSPYLMNYAVTVERQLPKNTTVAMSYNGAHYLHLFRSNDINAPVPGSGLNPLGRPGPVFLVESAGLYNQNQLFVNVNSKINSGFSLFGYYVLNKAMSNTDGINTFPANPYNFSGEYGPALTDVRHRGNVGGSINFRWNIRVSPFFVLQTGAPFDITTGSDLYGTTLFNARPGMGTPGKPGLIATPYGLLDPNPTPGEVLLGRNSGRGPRQITMNLRVAKTIGFGGEKKGAVKGGDQPGRPSGGGGGGGGTGGMVPAAVGGGGMGNVIGRPTTTRRYNLSLSMSVRNLLNHNNPGPIIGNVTSPLFGLSNMIAGNPNGEGFYETANNRRLEMQIRFSF